MPGLGPQVDLTFDQKEAWTRTMELMEWVAPGFRHLWYRLLVNNDGQYRAIMERFNYPGSEEPGVAYTDGANVVCNPDTFFKYKLAERVFIAAHEIAHNMYDDVNTLHKLRGSDNITCSDGSVFPYDEMTMQKVMDYRINAMLVESRIGAMPKDALYDPEIAKGKDGIYDCYGKVYKQDQDGGPSGGYGSGPGKGNQSGQNGFDPGGVQPPGTTTGQGAAQAVAQHNPQQWQVEMAHARHIEEQRHHGNMPAGMKRMFDDILDPTIPWADQIETMCRRMIGRSSYSWRKADRRFITRDLYMPGRCGDGAGWLVVWGDTSGSIAEPELNKYLGELKGVIEDNHPRRLTVVWHDCGEINEEFIDEIAEESDLSRIKARGVGGGGGTSVEPVFEWITQQVQTTGELPDMFIGMTDGDVSFPEKPPYPVIWASITDVEYPYGETVRIK